MSPSSKRKRRTRAQGLAGQTAAAAPAADWALAFYATADGRVPAQEFLLDCPQPVREMLLAILVAVRDAPPPAFPPSNMWHAMHGDMKGLHEARDAHDGRLYRVFCLLDSRAPENGLDAKALVLLSAAVKRVGSAMDRKAYDQALANRADYLKTRRIALPADPSKRRSTSRPT
jgi:hypothetical protein